MSPKMEDRLFNRVREEHKRGKEWILPLHLDLTVAMSLVATIQLAMRHPGFVGPTRDTARKLIDGIIQRVKQDGFDAHAELMLLGDDPDYDSEMRRPS